MAAANHFPAVADGDDHQRHIFPFFDLPQELRDEIYDLSLTRYFACLSCGFSLEATDIPAIDLLLVSKAFAREYQLRAKKKSEVAIMDTSDWSPGIDVCLPQRISRFHTVRACLACDFDYGIDASEVEGHSLWLRELAASAKQPYSLSIHVNHSPSHDGLCVSSLFQEWTALQGVKELKLYQRTSSKALFDFASRAGLHLEWSSITGKLEKVSATIETLDEEM